MATQLQAHDAPRSQVLSHEYERLLGLLGADFADELINRKCWPSLRFYLRLQDVPRLSRFRPLPWRFAAQTSKRRIGSGDRRGCDRSTE